MGRKKLQNEPTDESEQPLCICLTKEAGTDEMDTFMIGTMADIVAATTCIVKRTASGIIPDLRTLLAFRGTVDAVIDRAVTQMIENNAEAPEETSSKLLDEIFGK